jgi:LysM repeat protein
MNRIMPCHSPDFRRRWVAFWLALWTAAISFSAVAADEFYTVKRGDTLWGIARKHDVSVAQLADKNGLSRNHYVLVGQRLLLPSKSAGSSGPSISPLPSGIQTEIDKARVKAGRWKYIVIHHSGVNAGTVKGMDRYHRENRRMENGLAYHFVVGNGKGMRNGEIAAGSRWIRQLDGGHLNSAAQNRFSLGICLVGNFDQHKPTPKQMQQLTALVRALMKRCQISSSAVRTHQQINVVHTRCPGRLFPMKSLMASLSASGK